jgi:hypothetical protein
MQPAAQSEAASGAVARPVRQVANAVQGTDEKDRADALPNGRATAPECRAGAFESQSHC